MTLLATFVLSGSLVARSAQLTRQPITSHPSVKSELETLFDYSEDSIIVSGKLVTTYIFFWTFITHLFMLVFLSLVDLAVAQV